MKLEPYLAVPIPIATVVWLMNSLRIWVGRLPHTS